MTNERMLYLHFPFCKRKCKYCDFYSVTDLSLKKDFVTRLVSDIRDSKEEYPDTTLSSVYLGGGTPSILDGEDLEKIFSAIKESFPETPDCEITVEVNPESVTDGFLKSAKKSGVNRISMGMQSADDGELEAIGRLHDFSEVERKVALIRENGFSNFSLDLMYALPGQTLQKWLKNLENAVALGPKHISLYALTLSESVPLFKRINEVPDDEIQRKMYLEAIAYLHGNGFEQYEISNCAVPSFESRHNLGYWQGKEYIGLGPGAHSFVGKKRFSVKSDVRLFLSENDREKILTDPEPLSFEDEYTEYVFLSLRTVSGIDPEYVGRIFGDAKKEKCEKLFRELEKHGLCTKTENGFCLTPEGFFVSDSVISKLI